MGKTKFYDGIVGRTLGNGVRVFLLPRPGGAVEAECFLKTGSIHEGEALGCGLSHFLEHMVFQGSAGYPGTAAAETVDRLGGSMNAYTSYDHTAYHVHIAGRHLAAAVDVLSAMVLHPEFPAERFDSEREVILRERELGCDNPDRRLCEELMRGVFQVNPLRHPIIGYRELIAGVTRERMTDYYERRYTPQRCFWVIVGDFEPETAFSLIRSKLESWPVSHVAEPVLPAEPEQMALRRSEFEFDDPLARLALGFRIPPVSHRDIPALDVLAGILGMGEGSRLVRVLEREQELAVQLRSFCHTQSVGGLIGIVAGTRPDRLDRLERSLRRELKRIREDGLSRAEIEREKTQQWADHLRELAGIRETAANIGGSVIAGNSPDLCDSYLARLRRLTRDEVTEVAERYLDEAHFCLVRQLPPKPGRAPSSVRRACGLAPECRTLRSGATLVTVTDRSLPLVQCAVVLPGGTIFESAGQGGISGLTADLLTAGTLRRGEDDILRAFDAGGAELNFTAGTNSLILELSAPRRYFAKVVGLFGELLGAPAFDEAAFDREKENRLELLRSRARSPRPAAADRARRALFGRHPYAWGTAGTEEQLENIRRSDVAAFFAERWHAGQVFFGFGGDCSAREAAAWAEMLSAGVEWRSGELALPPPPEFPTTDSEFTLALPREQTAVVKAVPGPSALDGTEFAAFEILHQAENGLAARIFKNVREEHAMAYTTGMRMSAGLHPGALMFYAVTTAEQAAEAAALLNAELVRLGAEGLESAEFEAAREGAAFQAARQCESSSAALVSSLLALYYHQEPDAPWRHEAEVRALGRAEVNGRLRNYFRHPPVVTGFAGRTPE